MGQDMVLDAKTPTTASQPHRKRRFQPDDIIAIAQLIAKGCNETESCKLLGFHYDSWHNWKSKPKNKSIYDGALQEIKGQIIVNCINGIEKAGLKDWRALRERLALLDRDRFSDKANNQPQQINVQVFAQIDAVLSKVYAEPAKQVIDVKEVKQLPSGTSTSSPSGMEQH